MKRAFLFTFLIGMTLTGCSSSNDSIESNQPISETSETDKESEIDTLLRTRAYFLNLLQDYDINESITSKGKVLYITTANNQDFDAISSYLSDYAVQDWIDYDTILFSQYDNHFLEYTFLIDCKTGESSICQWYNDNGELSNPTSTVESESISESEITTTPKNDFFSTVTEEDFYDMIEHGKYDAIYDKAISYLSDDDINANDSAYIIKETLQPLMKVWSDITIEYDSIDNIAYFYYKNIKDINSSVHFVPYATSSEKNIIIKTGFYSSEWIFFEDIKFDIEEHIFLSEYKGKIEDVVSGGIYEEQQYYMNDEDIAIFNSTDNFVIRFQGENKHLDFSISDEELEAFNVISNFYNVRNILSNLCYNYFNPN